MDVASKSACPVCGGVIFGEAVSDRVIGYELGQQHDFIASRLRRNAPQSELKDLTDFMHGDPAPLYECLRCGLLLRDEPESKGAASYEEDPNDPDLMAQVYPKYVDFFRKKEDAIRAMLRPGADVLELGSHLGAFLQTAEEWSWTPVGLDVGLDTTEFVRSKGLRVDRAMLEDADLPSQSFDAIFIWNCFEQLTDPLPVLQRAREVLKDGGLLTVRVPNATSYKLLRAHVSATSMNAMALNNLLGFPYLYGYSIDTLNRVLARSGFELVRGFNSELITTPYPDSAERLWREQREMSSRISDWSTRTSAITGMLTGPWIEAVYRKLSDGDVQSKGELDGRFLPRAA